MQWIVSIHLCKIYSVRVWLYLPFLLSFPFPFSSCFLFAFLCLSVLPSWWGWLCGMPITRSTYLWLINLTAFRSLDFLFANFSVYLSQGCPNLVLGGHCLAGFRSFPAATHVIQINASVAGLCRTIFWRDLFHLNQIWTYAHTAVQLSNSNFVSLSGNTRTHPLLNNSSGSLKLLIHLLPPLPHLGNEYNKWSQLPLYSLSLDSFRPSNNILSISNAIYFLKYCRSPCSLGYLLFFLR